MKKFLATGLLAICAIALSQQQASAWINTKFGVGLNWGWQSGGNNFGWGAWRNGQPPGPEAFQGGGYGHGHGHEFYHGHGHHHSMVQPQGMAPAPYAYTAPMPEPAYAQPAAPYGTPFHYATYPRPVYYYYGR